MSQAPSAGSETSSGSAGQKPRAASSGARGDAPMRFTNQLESGTSSNALTFVASPPGTTAKKRETGRKMELSAASHENDDSYSSGRHATFFGSCGSAWQAASTRSRSWSRTTGGASGNRRGSPCAHAVSAHAATSSGDAAESARRTDRSKTMVRPDHEAEGADVKPALERIGAR